MLNILQTMVLMLSQEMAKQAVLNLIDEDDFDFLESSDISSSSEDSCCEDPNHENLSAKVISRKKLEWKERRAAQPRWCRTHTSWMQQRNM